MSRPMIRVDTDALASEYLAGSSYRKLGKRHGMAITTVYRRLRALVDEGQVSAFVEVREDNRQRSIERIANAVGQAFELPPGHIWRETRKAEVVSARYAVFLLAYEMDLRQSSSARAFEMDRSTVSYGIARARSLAATDFLFSERLKAARKALAA